MLRAPRFRITLQESIKEIDHETSLMTILKFKKLEENFSVKWGRSTTNPGEHKYGIQEHCRTVI